MRIRDLERRIVVGSRFLAFIAVAGSLAGAALMFCLGALNVYMAFRHGLAASPEGTAPFGMHAVISLVEALDRFLIAIVMLYFTYGVYSLFIHPEVPEETLALPAWLRIGQIGQLKQVVAELILIVLFVLFLRQALETFATHTASLDWPALATLLVLPVSAVLLALSLRLVEFHPKGRANDDPERDRKPTDPDRA
jgi:uncharacterized membrane protein YqhA